MNKLVVRLVATCAVAIGMGAPAALADGASINTTGPGSNNVISSSNLNQFCQSVLNRVQIGNFNNQSARSGNIWIAGNTKVDGNGLGSGSAANWNSGQNNVFISNSGSSMPVDFGNGGGNNASIFLTGPGSNNRISSNTQNRVNQSTVNNVSANNSSSQTARSGGLTITGNTVVTGVGGTGNAVNQNSGENTVSIDNTGSMPVGFTDNNGGNSAAIGITGPNSNNQILGNNSSSFNSRTVNDVSATNSNRQSATTGNLTISGNTVVSGVGGSGSAFNSNMGTNNVGLSN